MTDIALVTTLIALLLAQLAIAALHDRHERAMRASVDEMTSEVAKLRRVLHAMTIPPAFREPEDEP